MLVQGTNMRQEQTSATMTICQRWLAKKRYRLNFKTFEVFKSILEFLLQGSRRDRQKKIVFEAIAAFRGFEKNLKLEVIYSFFQPLLFSRVLLSGQILPAPPLWCFPDNYCF